MSAVSKKDRTPVEKIVEAYERLAGNVRATAAELGISRRTVLRNMQNAGKVKKPLVAGSVQGLKATKTRLPPEGKVKRYILTSAQNNTYVNEKAWEALLLLSMHYDAEILVGTFSYNQNAYGKLAVKRGKEKDKQKDLWYDDRILPFIRDERVELGRGLVWCGEMNILPTAVNPLAGLESYSERKSAIFPHVKQAMRSVPTMQGEGTKLNYTTGTVTQRNYIQKRDGLIAEYHHIYGGLLVEVNHDGHWWVRQLNYDSRGTLQDLDVKVENGQLTSGNRVEAITWGDLHATWTEEAVTRTSMEMLEALRPRYQFLHDLLEGASITHHAENNPHAKFYTWLRGLSNFKTELERSARLVEAYARPWSQLVAVDSNHDNPWIQRWLREHDYRKDPPNSELFLRAQAYLYGQIREGKMPRDVNMLEWCLKEAGLKAQARFLRSDESFLICGRRIQCGMHGHLGPNGTFGSPRTLAGMGRRANTAHTHSAGIYNGLYVAGTSSKLRWDYNQGPSSWSHSHIVTYPNGKRSIVTVYDGKWRAS